MAIPILYPLLSAFEGVRVCVMLTGPVVVLCVVFCRARAIKKCGNVAEKIDLLID